MILVDSGYIKGAVDLDEINSAIKDIWTQLGNDSQRQALMPQYSGFGAVDFTRKCPIAMCESSAGIEHSGVTLALHLAVEVATGLTKDTLVALFKTVILPKLKKHLGVGALEERPPPS